MTGKFNHRRSSILLAGLSIAVFLTTSLLIANGQGYYDLYTFNNQATLDHNDAARTYQNSYGEYYDPHSYNNDPQSALDLLTLQGQTKCCTTMIPVTGNTGPTYG